MRVLMDFDMNKEIETKNGIRTCDIEEVQRIVLTPCWNGDSKKRKNNPDDLQIALELFGQPWDFSIFGWYNLDGKVKTVKTAMENYNKVINKVMETGYCKISDFENVTWQ